MGMMKRFSAYPSRLCEVMGHADRKGPMRENFTGLMLPLKIIVNDLARRRQTRGRGARPSSIGAGRRAARSQFSAAPKSASADFPCETRGEVRLAANEKAGMRRPFR